MIVTLFRLLYIFDNLCRFFELEFLQDYDEFKCPWSEPEFPTKNIDDNRVTFLLPNILTARLLVVHHPVTSFFRQAMKKYRAYFEVMTRVTSCVVRCRSSSFFVFLETRF